MKYSMKCECGSPRPVDTKSWSPPELCRNCKNETREKDEEQMKKYREMWELLEEMEASELEDHVYNYLTAWCAPNMEDVFSDRDIVYGRTCHYVHTICMEHEQWEAAILYGKVALTTFSFYYGESSKVVAALLLRLGEACSA